jgi:hypothetical protein
LLQVAGGGAKKQRQVPSGRLRQNAPSGEGCASVNGIFREQDIAVAGHGICSEG